MGDGIQAVPGLPSVCYVWSGLYRCVLEGTHVCRHSTPQKAIWCLPSTQHSPSFSLTVCHFLSTSLFWPAAETRPQFAPGLMQCYGHSNKSHTWMPGTHTRSFEPPSSLSSLIHALSQPVSYFTCCLQESINNTSVLHTTALAPLLSLHARVNGSWVERVYRYPKSLWKL